MRKLGLVVAFVLGLIGLGATPSLAQSAADVPVCAGVQLLSPADGAVLDPDYRVRFTWSAEPKGTASRDWVSIRLGATKDGNFSIAEGTHAKAEKGQYKAFARGRPGIYTWFVIFKDAKGHVICMSKSRTYVVGDNSSNESLMAQASNPTVTVTVSKGKYIVHLMGNPAGRFTPATDNTTGYAGGVANWEKPGNTYVDSVDATGAHDWQALGYDSLEIWGNGDGNVIVGSNKGDTIYGLAGNDVIAGLGGDDTINGGDESCSAFCTAGDAISGGDGNDTINGGNETCAGFCSAGDAISGDDGSDTINGGDETCVGFCNAGDALTGNFPFNIEDGDKDVVNGQGGNDTAVGTGADVVTP
jgi:Ca2+-binding RTX toxin-like protein